MSQKVDCLVTKVTFTVLMAGVVFSYMREGETKDRFKPFHFFKRAEWNRQLLVGTSLPKTFVRRLTNTSGRNLP